jgi:hypothetical protein
MSNGAEQMQVEFHNKAKETFFLVYHAFESAISRLNRRTDEFRFQQVKKQYTVLLEQELQTVAEDLLVRHRDEKQVREIDQVFHQFMKDYLHRFVQKINAL